MKNKKERFNANTNEKSKKKEIEWKRQVILTRQSADGIITYSKTWHPHEGILILQGKSKKNGEIRIDGLVVPPFASSGPYYSGFPTNELPMDLSYIGTAHSHPGSSNRPSLPDLNNFFGVVSIIISYPYEYETIAAYDRNGNNISLIIE
ncbi:MAG: putative Mov34/MPN/PAD family protein [Nitrososphaeraceae archaeon]|nr:putative Mov34/MPN/PAD family protein [Nitrososphaeraceae archaeon]